MADEINTKRSSMKQYSSAASRMREASNTKTAEMMRAEAAIAAQELKREELNDHAQAVLDGKEKFDGEKHNQGVMRQQAKIDASQALHRANYEQASELRDIGARKSFVSSVNNISKRGVSSFSSVDRARAAQIAVEGISSGRYTESSVNKGLERLQGQQVQRRDSLIAEAKNPDGTIEDYMGRAGELEGTKFNLATLRSASSEFKRQGIDSESVRRRTNKLSEQILGNRGDSEIADRVSSGATGSLSTEQSKLKGSQDEFLKAQEAFTKALNGPTAELEEFKKALLVSTKGMEDQSKLVKEMERQGAGGGLAQKVSTIGSALRTAANVGSVGANIYMDAAVSSEIQQMQLRSGFARVQNQGFMDHYGAAQGDMTSYFQVMNQSNSRSTGVGEKLGGKADTAVGVRAGAGILGVGGDALQGGAAGVVSGGIMGSMVPVVGTKIGAMLGGITGAITGGVNSAQGAAAAGVDYAKGLTAGSTRLQTYGARRDIDLATNEIKSAASQVYLDSSMGNFAASQGFGGNREGAFTNMQDNMSVMAKYGLKASDTQALYAAGMQSGGDAFTRLGATGMQSTVERAGQVGVSGVTDAQDYISRIGQMSQVGGGGKQVEDILANAVARGVDNAKSFGEVVDSISQMSSASASRGVDTSQVMTRSTLAMLDTTKDNGLNQRLNLNSAQQQQRLSSELSSDAGTNFSTVMEQAKFSSGGLGDVSQLGRAGLGRMDLATAKTLSDLAAKGDSPELRAAIERTPGAGEILLDENGNLRSDANSRVNELKDIKVNKILDSGASFQDSNQRERIKKAAKSGDYKGLRQEDKNSLNNMGMTSELFSSTSDREASRGSIPNQGANTSAAQNIKNAGAESEVTMAAAGKEFTAGLKTLGANMLSIAKMLNPQEASARSTNAAASMTLDASAFDGGVKNFNMAVDRLLEKLGEKSNSVTSTGKRIPQTAEEAKAMASPLWTDPNAF